jgi:NAD+ synthase (glutamine-hydrolysing)
MWNGVKYNCRVLFADGKILLIRPKMTMANDGNYRESRWFTAWSKPRQTESFMLPSRIRQITGQQCVPFGDSAIQTSDGAVLGCEICEELFAPDSPHTDMARAGVEVFMNGSASHHELRKLNKRLDLICGATRKLGGVYIYSNCRGCDGERTYYDGCPLIVVNGNIVAGGRQFSLQQVEVVSATVDLDEVRSYRGSSQSRNVCALPGSYPVHSVDFSLLISECEGVLQTATTPTEIDALQIDPSEEISLGPACWLWDYLRRSGAAGFLLPLSGGIDSCSTALIVYSMCRQVCQACQEDSVEATKVLTDVRRIIGVNEISGTPYTPTDPRELMQRLMHTCYMGSASCSSQATRTRATKLADAIGSYHISCNIDSVVDALLCVFQTVTSRLPRFRVHHGSHRENLALQNIQV